MSRNAIPWLVASGAAVAILCLGKRCRRSGASPDRGSARGQMDTTNDSEVRNAALKYRPVGGSGESYPDWVRALDGKSGVYILRETQDDGTTETVYVGESHTGRLYQTLTRHFQTWRRAKKFWTGQYTGSQSHDPGVTYDRERIIAAVRVLPAARALEEEARLIARLRPRDNLIGQPVDEDQDEVIPF
jgi:hypothetical protein